MTTPLPAAPVRRVIDAYPVEARDGVLALRQLIYEVAATLPDAGPLNETLKWSQPAYVPARPRTGSALRLGLHGSACFALFAHCRTTIIADYARAFPAWDRIDGNRAVLFDGVADVEPVRLSHLIRHALTYHLAPASEKACHGHDPGEPLEKPRGPGSRSGRGRARAGGAP